MALSAASALASSLSIQTQSVVAPPLTASTTTPNGISTSDNVDNGALSSAPDSPAIPSPPTNAASPPVKIDLGYSRESDVRHEPVTVPIQKSDDMSVRPQIGTPIDPGMCSSMLSCLRASLVSSSWAASIPIDPPHGTPPPPTGTLLEDVQMAEQPAATPAATDATEPPSSASTNTTPLPNGVNGVNGIKEDANGVNGHASPAPAATPADDPDSMHVDEKTPVASTSRLSEPRDMEVASPAASPALASAATAISTDQPPPFKRARTDSDAEMSASAAAMAQVSTAQAYLCAMIAQC